MAATGGDSHAAASEHVVLVTGGTGLVGHGIRHALAQEAASGQQRPERWVFLSSKDADLRSREDTERIFALHKPTHVIHLAARVGGLFANMKYPVEFWQDNVSMNNNIFECCRKFHVKKLVSCLSTCIFPDKTTYPIDETMLHNGAPHSSNEPYAYAKRMIEVLNRAYHSEYGCHFTSVIPTNIFGPYDNWQIEGGHVIPALIHRMHLAKQADQDFLVYGSGAPLRQFVFSHDLGRLFVWVLRDYQEIDPIILSVSPEAEVSIATVAYLIADALQYPRARIKFDTSKADGQFKKTANNAKLMRLLPNFAFTPLEKAIHETVTWFLANQASIRK